MMPPWRASEARAGPLVRHLPRDLARDRCASRRFDVMRTARASGSCSACAMRSAASHAGRPRSDRIRISLGPAWKSIAHVAET